MAATAECETISDPMKQLECLSVLTGGLEDDIGDIDINQQEAMDLFEMSGFYSEGVFDETTDIDDIWMSINMGSQNLTDYPQTEEQLMTVLGNSNMDFLQYITDTTLNFDEPTWNKTQFDRVISEFSTGFM